MAKTTIKKDETLEITSPFAPMDTSWLDKVLADGNTLRQAISDGLAKVTKEDNGDIFTKWNNFIAQVAQVVPELKSHLTIRKTKKGVKYYGVDHDLYTALKNDSTELSLDGLPAL